MSKLPHWDTSCSEDGLEREGRPSATGTFALKPPFASARTQWPQNCFQTIEGRDKFAADDPIPKGDKNLISVEEIYLQTSLTKVYVNSERWHNLRLSLLTWFSFMNFSWQTRNPRSWDLCAKKKMSVIKLYGSLRTVVESSKNNRRVSKYRKLSFRGPATMCITELDKLNLIWQFELRLLLLPLLAQK